MQLTAATVDLDTGTVTRDGADDALLPTELALLRYLAARSGQPVGRDELLVEVWGYAEGTRSRTVDTTIKTLRRKIEADPKRPDHLRTVRGVGYTFTPATGTAAAVGDLPTFAAPFVGREADLRRLRDALDAGDRLVTVQGPAGIGKTRLAVRGARDAGGGWFCALGGTREPGEVLSAVASVLGVPLSARDRIGALARAVDAHGATVVVLDNAEQLTDPAVEAIGDLLRATSAARFVVTSRRPLRLDGERRLALDPLPPGEARDLLLDRGQRVRPDFGDAEPDAVTRLVDRLEGIPLALELAAARAATLSAAELADRLAEQLPWLDRGPRDAPDRHRTLRGALQWSWELLTDDERAALSQCAAFPSDFVVAGAEAVVAIEGARVLDRVEALQEWSLLHAHGDPRTGEVRLSMLASVREWVREQAPPSPACRARHAAWTVARCGALAEASDQHGGAKAWAKWAREADDLAAATRADDDGVAVRAALLLDRLRVHLGLGVERLPDLHEAVRRASDPTLEVTALRARADARLERGAPPADIDADLDRALAVARAAEDARLEGRVLGSVGIIRMQQGRLDEAAQVLQQALALARAEGDVEAEADRTSNLGQVHATRGNHDAALEMFGAALALHRRRGHHTHIGKVLGHLGALHLKRGEVDQAERCYQRARASHRDVGYAPGVLRCTGNLAILLASRGAFDDARDALLEVLAEARRTGDGVVEGVALVQLGRIAALSGRPVDALDAAHEAEVVLQEAGWDGLAEESVLVRALAHHAGGRPGSALRLLGSLRASTDLRRRALAALVEAIVRLETDDDASAAQDALAQLASVDSPEHGVLAELLTLAVDRHRHDSDAIRGRLEALDSPGSDLGWWLLRRLQS